MPQTKTEKKISNARRLYQIAKVEFDPADARKENNPVNAARGFRMACDWLFEVIDEQQREIERMERENAPLQKPVGKCVTLADHNGVEWRL